MKISVDERTESSTTISFVEKYQTLVNRLANNPSQSLDLVFDETSADEKIVKTLFQIIDKDIVKLDTVALIIPLISLESSFARGFYGWYSPKSTLAREYANVFKDTVENKLLLVTSSDIFFLTTIQLLDDKTDYKKYATNMIEKVKFTDISNDIVEFAFKAKDGHTFYYNITRSEAENIKKFSTISDKIITGQFHKGVRYTYIALVSFLILILIASLIKYIS